MRPSGSGESAKDRAENVMIVDLMRNDLGRVCEYGSVEVAALTELREAPGVWHLVSSVRGRLRPGLGDSDLLRATFPPGSVTGAPKIRAMRVIAELEASGREAYTGAIGFASPLAGLELSVVIRTLELSGDRIWLGAGGGVVADSDPDAELEECLVKARPVVAAAGGELAEVPIAAAGPAVPFAIADGAGRPDPSRGVISTMLVRDGLPVDLPMHLARLEDSVGLLYERRLPAFLEARIFAEASAWPLARLRVTIGPRGDALEIEPLAREPGADALRLAPVVLPGGLGEHKWRDRGLLDELARRSGAVPLLVDLDGDVLEAAHANVWVLEGDLLVTPPLDGRILPGTVRARLLGAPPAGLEARAEPLSLERLAAADEILLSSSVRGVHPATLGPEPARFDGRRSGARGALRERAGRRRALSRLARRHGAGEQLTSGIAGQVDLHQPGRGACGRSCDLHAHERVTAHGRVGRRCHGAAELGHVPRRLGDLQGGRAGLLQRVREAVGAPGVVRRQPARGQHRRVGRELAVGQLERPAADRTRSLAGRFSCRPRPPRDRPRSRPPSRPRPPPGRTPALPPSRLPGPAWLPP